MNSKIITRVVAVFALLSFYLYVYLTSKTDDPELFFGVVIVSILFFDGAMSFLLKERMYIPGGMSIDYEVDPSKLNYLFRFTAFALYSFVFVMIFTMIYRDTI
ncbi:MAG: hypothetical protein V7707_08250 [Motiliproteus sp.]